MRGVVRGLVLCLVAFALLPFWGHLLAWGVRSDSVRLAERTRLLLRLGEAVYWPDMETQTHFRIELLDTTPAHLEPLLRSLGERRVHGKPLVVERSQSWLDRSGGVLPHMFYVSASFTKWLPQIHSYFSGHPVLVVSEEPYSGSGWMAHFDRFSRPGMGVDSVLVWSLNATNMFSIAGLTTSAPSSKSSWVTRRGSSARSESRVLTASAALDSVPRLVEHIARQRDTVVALRRQIVHLRWQVDSLQQVHQPYSTLPFSWVSSALGRSFVAREAARGVVAEAAQDVGSGSGAGTLGVLWVVGLGSLAVGGVLAFGFGASGNALGHALRGRLRSLGRFVSGAVLVALPGRRAMGGVPSSRTEGTENGGPARVGGAVGRLTRKRYLEEVSHEIRTPLNAIVGLSQYIAEPSASEEEKREGVGLISRSVFELTTRLNSMVLLAKLEAHRVEEHASVLVLGEFLWHIAQQVRESVAAAGRADTLSLRCLVPEHLVSSQLRCDLDNLVITIDMLVALHVRVSECSSIELGCERSGEGGVRLFVRGLYGFGAAWPGEEVAGGWAYSRVDAAYINALPGSATELAVAAGLQELRGAHLDSVSLPSVGVEYSFCFEEA